MDHAGNQTEMGYLLRTEILRRELRYGLHRISIAVLRYNSKYFISRNRGGHVRKVSFEINFHLRKYIVFQDNIEAREI